MSKIKLKIVSIFSLVFLLASCQPKPDTPDVPDTPDTPDTKPKEETLSYSPLVYNLENLGYITGSESPGKTQQFDVGGTDLGYPLYIPEIDKTYFFFGDSFTNGQTGHWRSNTVGICEDKDLSDGITLNNFLTASSGYTTYVINGHHDNSGVNEVTKIPTGVIDIDGTIYMFYFSMFNWNAASDNMMNYGGCVKSNNFGQTWQRVYDLTWINPSCTNSKENITGLINEDANNIPNKGNIKYEDHIGFDMTQICPFDGKDGYIYLFLEGGYRNRGLKLARVLKENFEIFSEYEYFLNKFDDNGAPLFKKGAQGAAYLKGKTSTEIINSPFGEMCALYNPYLKKYCLMTATGASVMMFISDNIYGPYSPVTIFPSSSSVIPLGSIYAPLSCEHMLEENGKVMYMLTSTWLPKYNPSFIKVTFV